MSVFEEFKELKEKYKKLLDKHNEDYRLLRFLVKMVRNLSQTDIPIGYEHHLLQEELKTWWCENQTYEDAVKVWNDLADYEKEAFIKYWDILSVSEADD